MPDPAPLDAEVLNKALRSTFDSGRTRPVAWRKEQLAGLRRMLEECDGELVDALCADLGRPRMEAFFADIVRGVVGRQKEVDAAIARRLASGWRLDRLDATARAILRDGAYELTHPDDVPTEVVIDEYVELAKSFFEGPEPGFVNGALDAVAQDVRA